MAGSYTLGRAPIFRLPGLILTVLMCSSFLGNDYVKMLTDLAQATPV